MALLKTTLSEMSKYDPLPPDTYTLEVIVVNENQLTKNNKPGTELYLKVLDEGSCRGREVRLWVSDNFLSPLFKLAAACLGKDVKDLADASGEVSIDPAALVGMTCRAVITPREYEGKTFNSFGEFFPTESVSNTESPSDDVI